MNEGPDLGQPVTVSGANEPLNVMDAQEMKVSRGAERALAGMVDNNHIKPGSGVNAMAMSMMEATAAIYTAHNKFEAQKGPSQDGPSIGPNKPKNPSM